MGVCEIISSNERTIDFLKYDGVMRGGEELDSGVTNLTGEFSSSSGFSHVLPSKTEIRHLNDRIKFHPPWLNEGAPIGYGWLEVDMFLEEYGKTEFTASPAMQSAANATASDGALYRFSAWAKDNPDNVISNDTYITSEIGTPVKMDLTAFEGCEITFRTVCM